jgi:hypothetical protein
VRSYNPHVFDSQPFEALELIKKSFKRITRRLSRSLCMCAMRFTRMGSSIALMYNQCEPAAVDEATSGDRAQNLIPEKRTPNGPQPPPRDFLRQTQCHSERRWDEFPQVAALGSRLFAPTFMPASIV